MRSTVVRLLSRDKCRPTRREPELGRDAARAYEQDAGQGEQPEWEHEREPGLEAGAEQEEEADPVPAPDERARKDSRLSADRRRGEDEHRRHAKGKDEQHRVPVLGEMARGDRVDALLGKVEKRRLFPTRVIQAAQKTAQDRVIGRLLLPGEPIRKAPLVIRLLDRFPLLRRIPGRFIGLGIRRERVWSPEAPSPARAP